MTAAGCPSWCTEPGPCRGDHWGSAQTYHPADLSRPIEADSARGAIYPAIGISIADDRSRGGSLRLALHEAAEDRQYDFSMDGAFALMTELAKTWARATEGVEHAGVGMGDPEQFFAAVDAIRDALMKKTEVDA